LRGKLNEESGRPWETWRRQLPAPGGNAYTGTEVTGWIECLRKGRRPPWPEHRVRESVGCGEVTELATGMILPE